MTKAAINEKDLSKGELRKLRALRKSLGQEIADEAFAKWKEQQAVASGNGEFKDTNAELIEEALAPLLDKLRMPRGVCYSIRRGRGRFIVEPADLH